MRVRRSLGGGVHPGLPAGRVARTFHIGQLLLNGFKLLQQLLFFGAELTLSVTLDIIDHRERTLVPTPATQADKVCRTRQIFQNVGKECTVIGIWHGDALPEQVLHCHPKPIGQHIHISNNNEADGRT